MVENSLLNTFLIASHAHQSKKRSYDRDSADSAICNPEISRCVDIDCIIPAHDNIGGNVRSASCQSQVGVYFDWETYTLYLASLNKLTVTFSKSSSIASATAIVRIGGVAMEPEV